MPAPTARDRIRGRRSGSMSLEASPMPRYMDMEKLVLDIDVHLQKSTNAFHTSTESLGPRFRMIMDPNITIDEAAVQIQAKLLKLFPDLQHLQFVDLRTVDSYLVDGDDSVGDIFRDDLALLAVFNDPNRQASPQTVIGKRKRTLSDSVDQMDTEGQRSGQTDISDVRVSSIIPPSQAQQSSGSNSKRQYPIVVVDETPKDLSVSSLRLLERPTQNRTNAVAMQDEAYSSPDFPLAGRISGRGQAKNVSATDATGNNRQHAIVHEAAASKNLELVKVSREPANRKRSKPEASSSKKVTKPKATKKGKRSQNNDSANADAANANGATISNQAQDTTNIADTHHSTKTAKPSSNSEPSQAANESDLVPTSKSSTSQINTKGSTKKSLPISKKDNQIAKGPNTADSPDAHENIDKHHKPEVTMKDKRQVKPINAPTTSTKSPAKEVAPASEAAGTTSISNTPKASRAGDRNTKNVNAKQQRDTSSENELPSPVIPQTQSPVQKSIEMTSNNGKESMARSRSSSVASAADLGSGVHERQETSSVSPELNDAESKPQILASTIQSPRKIIDSSEAERDSSDDDDEDGAEAKLPTQPQSVPTVVASGKSPVKGKEPADESSEESSSDEETSDSCAEDSSELNSKTKALTHHPIKPKLKPSELAFADEVESSQDSQRLVQKPATPKFISQTLPANAKSKPSLSSEDTFQRYARLSDIALSQEQIAKAKRRARLSATLQETDKDASIDSKTDSKAVKEDANRAALASLAKDDSSEDDSDSSEDAKISNKAASTGPNPAKTLNSKPQKTSNSMKTENSQPSSHTNIPANRLAGHGRKKDKNKSAK